MHYYVNLNGAGNKEYEFNSGIYGNPMLTWGQYMDWLLYNKKYYPQNMVNNEIISALQKQDEQNLNYNINNNTGLSVFDFISSINEFSKMKTLLEYVGYNKIFDNNITLFLPVDTMFDNVLSSKLNLKSIYTVNPRNQNLKWNGSDRYDYINALQTVRYHILPYVIKPWQLENRKLKLKTDLEGQFIETDFTNGKYQILNPIYIKNKPDDWFPKKEWEIDVLKSVVCNNGIIYIISRPLFFENIL